MYLRHLHIRNLRLIRDLELGFVDGNGEPRMWTVLIGRNGTGKTSILQAIALAAVGHLRANQLAGATAVSMPDRRHPNERMSIDAVFGFGRLGDGQHRRREYPGHPGKPPLLRSSLSMAPPSVDLVGGSQYLQTNVFEVLGEERIDPLQEARSKELPHWFVAGYGVSRHLAPSDVDREVGKPSHDRLVPLFRPAPLIGLGFADFPKESRSVSSRSYGRCSRPRRTSSPTSATWRPVVAEASRRPPTSTIEIDSSRPFPVAPSSSPRPGSPTDTRPAWPGSPISSGTTCSISERTPGDPT